MDFLKDIVKEIGDDYTKLASDIDETETYVDTGSYIFNALVSGSIFGGVSGNKITAIAGESSTGKTFPGGKVFEALVKLGFNANWLLAGKGSMKQSSASYPLAEGIKNADVTGDLAEGFVQIPRYEVAASAGGGSLIHSEQIVDHLTFRADWVKNALGVPVSSLVLINVKGDSMEPTLSNGDVILIDMSKSGFDDNAIYVLRLNGTLLVKRVKRNFDGSVLVSSDNPMYPPDIIKGDLVETLNVVGRVVWCGRRM